MLAQNLKTPAELNLEERHHRALVLTLNALERGELHHVPVDHNMLQYDNDVAPFTGHFNMSTWRVEYNCGTICCLGGTAEYLGDLPYGSLDSVASSNRVLFHLFYPDEMDKVMPERAAQVLRHYLTSGIVDWSLQP